MKTNNNSPTISLLQLLHLGAWAAVFFLSWGAFYQMMPFADSFWRSLVNTFLLIVLFYGVGELPPLL